MSWREPPPAITLVPVRNDCLTFKVTCLEFDCGSSVMNQNDKQGHCCPPLPSTVDPTRNHLHPRLKRLGEARVGPMRCSEDGEGPRVILQRAL